MTRYNFLKTKIAALFAILAILSIASASNAIDIGGNFSPIEVENVAELRTHFGNLTTNKKAIVLGHDTSGDGGGGPQRIWVEGAAPGTYVDNDGSIVVPGDGSAAWLFIDNNDYDLLSFGLSDLDSGDGNTAVVKAAIAAKFNNGGGGVYCEKPGIYLFDEDGLTDVCIELLSGVSLRGTNNGAVVFKLDDGENSHVINMTGGVDNVKITDLTIDGNRAANTSSVHGIRADGSVDGLTIRDVIIKDTGGYGIGLQIGEFKNIDIESTHISGTGSDGIDIKNTLDGNINNNISDVVIENFGLNNAVTVQAGIDLRGEWHLNNITCILPATAVGLEDRMGIRFREAGGATGEGARRSTLNNFRVIGDADVTTSAFGVYCAADSVNIGNGYVYGTLIGLAAYEQHIGVNNVTCEATLQTGFQTADIGALTAEYVKFVNCTAVDGSLRGFDFQSDFGGAVNCNAINNSVGVIMRAGALSNKFTDGIFDNNVTDVSDFEPSTSLIVRNRGYITETNISHPGLLVDSTGIQTFTIPHALGFAPDPEDISLTLLVDTLVNDYEIGYMRVNSTTAVNVVVFVNVTTASATGGALAKIGLKITKE